MRKKILNLFKSQPGRDFRQKELAHRLKLDGKQLMAMKQGLEELVKSGLIRHVKGKYYRLNAESDSFEGIISVTQKGFGFVIVGPDQPDIFIGRRQMGDAIHNDKVKVKLVGRQRVQGPRGKIVEVLERKTDRFIGVTYREGGELWLSLSPITPDRGIRLIRQQKEVVPEGKVVTARVKNWGSFSTPIIAEFEELLGDAGDPANDLKLILRKYEFEVTFPAEVQRQADRLSRDIISAEIPHRKDIRHWDAVTIDPEDARDFDDAISLMQTRDGYNLGVHIADVSHFIRQGSALDREALTRATSVYFSEGVVNMLPEKLSADLCSLKPHEDRLAVSCLMTLDKNFKVLKSTILPTVINSKQRFTYEQVQAILEGQKNHPLAKTLKLLDRLSRGLFKLRSDMGSIDFDIPEPIFSMGPEGIPHEIRPSERLRSHRMVEECMLLANRVVAEKIPGFLPKRYPFVYRVHEDPSRENVEQLGNLLSRLKLGIQMPKGDITPSDFKNLLSHVEDSPFKDLIENVTLRTMSKALYAIKNRGHFGLAFNHYTHFTSPIRRYPDLMVHRLIKMVHLNSFLPRKDWHAFMDRAVENTNTAEKVAVMAEREYIKIKQLRWLDQHIGEVFDGAISGVVNFGLFVEMEETLAEGLVHVDTLEGDDFIYDEDHYCLRGRKNHQVFRLGDRVRIRVLSVLFDKQRANFVMEN